MPIVESLRTRKFNSNLVIIGNNDHLNTHTFMGIDKQGRDIFLLDCEKQDHPILPCMLESNVWYRFGFYDGIRTVELFEYDGRDLQLTKKYEFSYAELDMGLLNYSNGCMLNRRYFMSHISRSYISFFDVETNQESYVQYFSGVLLGQILVFEQDSVYYLIDDRNREVGSVLTLVDGEPQLVDDPLKGLKYHTLNRSPGKSSFIFSTGGMFHTYKVTNGSYHSVPLEFQLPFQLQDKNSPDFLQYNAIVLVGENVKPFNYLRMPHHTQYAMMGGLLCSSIHNDRRGRTEISLLTSASKMKGFFSLRGDGQLLQLENMVTTGLHLFYLKESTGKRLLWDIYGGRLTVLNPGGAAGRSLLQVHPIYDVKTQQWNTRYVTVQGDEMILNIGDDEVGRYRMVRGRGVAQFNSDHIVIPRKTKRGYDLLSNDSCIGSITNELNFSLSSDNVWSYGDHEVRVVRLATNGTIAGTAVHNFGDEYIFRMYVNPFCCNEAVINFGKRIYYFVRFESASDAVMVADVCNVVENYVPLFVGQGAVFHKGKTYVFENEGKRVLQLSSAFKKCKYSGRTIAAVGPGCLVSYDTNIQGFTVRMSVARFSQNLASVHIDNINLNLTDAISECTCDMFNLFSRFD
ncbi:hypothetical protein PCE1_000444 [Barthelona sp. PCE]